MKIEFWLNILNPYCYIAHLRLKSALAQLYREDVEIQYKWFEEATDHQAQDLFVKNGLWDIKTYYAKNFEQSEVWAQLLFEDFKAQASAMERTFQIDSLQFPSNINLAEVIKNAELNGTAHSCVEWLFSQFWESNLKITQDNTDAFVLSSKELSAIPTSNKVDELLKEDQLLTNELEIQEAPMMIINEEIGLSGIQPIEHLVKMLTVAQSKVS